MKRVRRRHIEYRAGVWALLAWIAGCGSGLAPEFTPEPNGCGARGILCRLLLDCPLGLVCFTSACNDHDICYRTCGCVKVTCDDVFYGDLTSICAGRFEAGSRESRWCLDLAYVYWQAVVRFGEPGFSRLQREACAYEASHDRPAMRVRANATALPSIPPFEDEDDDLMPDEWESRVGLDPTDPTDAWGDSDGDGLVNLREFIESSDPFCQDANPMANPSSCRRPVRPCGGRAAGFAP